MNPRPVSRLRQIPVYVAYVVLFVSGIYVFVYLYRWEWNRALIAGVFFLATQVTLVAIAILARLRRIEERLTERPDDPVDVVLDEELAPHEHFAWLRDNDGMGVFVPVLLGAGVVLSALAWLVERLAARSARRLVAHQLGARPAADPANGVADDDPPRPLRAARPVAALLVVAVAALVGVDRLGDLTQDRPDVRGDEVATRVVMEVSTRDGTGVGAAASRLWAACETTLGPADAQVGAVVDGRVEVTVAPPVGQYAERRLRGCLEDATLDRVQARVVGLTHLPGTPQPSG